MIRKLTLRDFKSFEEAELSLGPITTVIGANASGKSNLRDAFRFLHGVARGYPLADIIGQRFGPGGYREWNGIRGGLREIARLGTSAFRIEVDVDMEVDVVRQRFLVARYSIEIGTNKGGGPPQVLRESLYYYRLRPRTPDIGRNPRPARYRPVQRRSEPLELVFDSHCPDDPIRQSDSRHLSVRFPRGGKFRRSGPALNPLSHQPALTQLTELAAPEDRCDSLKMALVRSRRLIGCLKSMKFLDLSPEAMRLPSTPGQDTLTDQGENLSGVLQAICQDPAAKAAMISLLEGLTPMDVADIGFVEDAQGRVTLELIEADGRRVSVHSASDGTLRFLGTVAALLGPRPARFQFIEEIDTGIHPVRMHLLFNFIERQVSGGGMQVFASTHSPQWLRFMSPNRLDAVALAYRVEGSRRTRLVSLDRIEHLRELVADSDIARLYEGGWMEESMFYKEGEPASIVVNDKAGSATDPEAGR